MSPNQKWLLPQCRIWCTRRNSLYIKFPKLNRLNNESKIKVKRRHWDDDAKSIYIFARPSCNPLWYSQVLKDVYILTSNWMHRRMYVCCYGSVCVFAFMFVTNMGDTWWWNKRSCWKTFAQIYCNEFRAWCLRQIRALLSESVLILFFSILRFVCLSFLLLLLRLCFYWLLCNC